MATPVTLIGALFPTASTEEATDVGFRFGSIGTHSSRTIMLSELTAVLDAVPIEALKESYTAAIIDGNCLAKSTVATRRLTSQRLSELYSLDPYTQIFRVMRRLWQLDATARPLLALLCSIARDPLLAATIPSVLLLAPGADFARLPMKQYLTDLVGDRFNNSTLDKVVRNCASSWTQSGHLEGRTLKKRKIVRVTVGAVLFGLFLAHKSGQRGQELFSSGWMSLLDCTAPRAQDLALEAKQLGLIDLSISGNIVDIRLDRLDPFFTRRF